MAWKLLCLDSSDTLVTLKGTWWHRDFLSLDLGLGSDLCSPSTWGLQGIQALPLSLEIAFLDRPSGSTLYMPKARLNRDKAKKQPESIYADWMWGLSHKQGAYSSGLEKVRNRTLSHLCGSLSSQG